MSSILNSVSSSGFCIKPSHQKPRKEDSIIDILASNTGFGDNALHYETSCKRPTLKTPLYVENYLTEFVTEEEKAAARHALGLYNKNDVVLLSLLTAEDGVPSDSVFQKATIKQLKKGDQFFIPVTSINAVYDFEGNTLGSKLDEINKMLGNQQKELLKITQVTNSKVISSLGDVKKFLQGFNNGDSLHDTLDEINQEMLRFEKTGDI
ncbi:MAG: hypothetical protein UF228_10320 [Lachnospiraceae bacterium]|nr:hypothetical protein [Lachnospiraceae bacterium]